MRRTKLSKGARRALLERFGPDGYVLVAVMDQTIGFWTGNGYTTKHQEALIYKNGEDADRECADQRAEYEAGVRRKLEGAATQEDREWYGRMVSERWFDYDPCVEKVLCARHFRDRPDTW